MTIRQALIRSLLILSIACFLPQEACPGSPGGDRVKFSEFIEKVEYHTGYSIAYATHDIETDVAVMPELTGLSAQEALWKILDREQYRLLTSGKHLIIKKNPPRETQQETAPMIATDLMLDKIPPPKQSVFSGGGSRLVIIRNTGKDMHMEMEEGADGETDGGTLGEQQDREGANMVVSNGIAAIDISKSSARKSRKTGAFREDLLETEVFNNDYAQYRSPKKGKKQSRRKKRS